MLGGTLANDPVALAPVNGARVVIRSVSTEDQVRWREDRHVHKMGHGALGDVGNELARSYPYVPIPEWLLDCCTACAEISLSAEFTSTQLDESFSVGAFESVHADELDIASIAAVDVLRLAIANASIQCPLTESILVATDGHYTRRHHGRSTPGFLWRHSEDRWQLSVSDAAILADLWQNYVNGPNRSKVRWPLRRFGVAAQRPFVEDRLVDRIIALEAIFGHDGDPIKGTGGRIASRANRLLGGKRIDMTLRSKRIGKAYEFRNDLVHGRLPPEAEIDAAAANMDSVLREGLRTLLNASVLIDPTAPLTQRPG